MHVVSVVKQLREIQLGYLSGVQSGYQSSHGGCDPLKNSTEFRESAFKMAHSCKQRTSTGFR